MSRTGDNDNFARKSSLAWLSISLVSVVIVSLILPFPMSFIVMLIIIISLNIIRADIALKRAGMGGISGWYKSFSSLQAGRGGDASNNNALYRPIIYACMSCGNEHNKTACPRCGSKAVKVS